ncbi:tRNA modification GTPase [Candidatus Carsonella ruddii PV]|uniref:tRNA modification GTPase MnmE n=1 Tax=Carsonella ruddii (strain PV) TaxID=387662 RepID=MNME_CARRP|nr:tRNA uridine-5-carboxymethylaminomethyl(34) synthesis GTPase MnmE [Candidatus Carsonella ruddii]Q05FY9.1 RecName: Full=tRNA modification GTPase MnmE [Candidatus Carsonella ruddii PV]BAF35032.1 tRNA modification GTPase [Candidatus Carsonella ruddii PV]
MNTIFSRITPLGNGTLCVIRISGKNVKFLIQKIVKKNIKEKIATFSKLFLDKECVDYAMIIFFKKPNTFTGEDIIEFHIHNNETIVKKIINYLLLNKARFAKAGEFLERRYLNGKISLIECELINNKILYDNENMFQLTKNSEKKIFLCIIKNLKFKINSLIICIEIANFNFSFFFFNDFLFIKYTFKKLLKLLKILIDKITVINYLKKNFTIMILGRRNVGKSTLFNKICAQYDSIVTNIPGTTKNIISKKIKILSKKIKMMDTAGLKIRTKNLIEKIGIIKNINKIYQGNLILYMIDKFNIKNIFFNIPIDFIDKIKLNELIILVNKSDILGKEEGVFKIKNILIILISSKNGTFIKNLKCFINKIVDNKDFSKNNYSDVKILFNKFSFFYKEFSCNYDLVLSKLIDFQKNIFKLTGNFTNKKIINSCFRNFCIGK